MISVCDALIKINFPTYIYENTSNKYGVKECLQCGYGVPGLIDFANGQAFVL